MEAMAHAQFNKISLADFDYLWITVGHSWDTPGTLLGHSWDTPGALLGHSWDTPGALLGHSWGTPGALLRHSWTLLDTPGTSLGLLWFSMRGLSYTLLTHSNNNQYIKRSC
ncbi:hypothetical protein K435DRAFT_793251 [Dendrothele bispora CBS 962.96]|uniref:Uncharacterized protein n=1 Tax=Dendrothele bispora (strain CBS 962.96) TaxID=1314807 RepID=A0A4S8MFV9_DENBC|nr:hypothetical protein K435DRAFT_793251 [Dendrothele bispora CBS 962.96]